MLIGCLLQFLRSYKPLKEHIRKIRKQWLWIILGGIAFASFPINFLSSVRMSGIAIGTVIAMGSSPIFSALIELVIDKQPLTKQWLMGFPLGLFGITLLSFFGVTHSTHQTHEADHTLLGCALAVMAGFGFSLNSWSMHRLIERHIPASAAAGTIFISGTFLASPLIIFSLPKVIAAKENIYLALYIGIVLYYLAYLCFSFGLSRIKTSTATVITLLEPVTATLLACLVAHEKLSVEGWIGIFSIMVCMIVMSLNFKRQK